MRKVLLSIFGPSNVVAALASVETYGFLVHGDSRADITTVLHFPGQGIETHEELKRVIDPMLQGRGHRPCIAIPQTSLPLSSLSSMIGDISEVHYAHNVVGEVTDICLSSYPNAEVVTFGDALGCIYDKNFHIALATGKPGEISDSRSPLAVVVLPMDQTGKLLDDTNLIIVPRNVAQSVTYSCISGSTDLAKYCAEIVALTSEPRYLMLLENISDGGFTTQENELALYQEIVESHIPKGASVIIKEHPLSVASIGTKLSDRLSNNYQTLVVSRDFSRSPVELWYDLLNNSILVGFSYACISVCYLYGVETIFPMSRKLIEKYFPEHLWPSYDDAIRAIFEQRLRVLDWDRASVLWAGNFENSGEIRTIGPNNVHSAVKQLLT